METPSTMIPLGTKAPDFKLHDTVSGKILELQQLKSNIATVIMFISNHCPYVKHLRKQLVEVAKEYQTKGIRFIAICSNDTKRYPEDSPKRMTEVAKELHFPFPYLHDETQEIAKVYQAACTPDFYVFDKDLKCVYRGQFDDSRPGNNRPVNGNDLRNALENILAGKPVDTNQKPSVGCNIKWR